ncbi:M23 family metallopeptidase [uncultured Gemmiger sp.]|uniref:M23 family metallopeptidase n=1 Tax=uncultured Gemmiger sp. TaxID=1623490 RepID=UPI0025F12F85|nr:M23 family metallopeptidase [uncultured Gemmiger sp.]
MDSLKTFLKEKGLYLVCLGLILAATVTSIWAIRNVMRGVEMLGASDPAQEESPWTAPDTTVNNPASNVPQTTPRPSAPPAASSSPSGASSQSGAGSGRSGTDADSSAQPAASYGLPVNGEVLLAFSGDDLVYNETLGDWRTHNGTDYACVSGDSIQTAAAGQVTAVYSDALWGGVVEVTDAEGRVWKYCGVDDAAVQQGDAVQTGALLGKAGAIPTEAGSLHLHLECLDGETWLDPAEIIAG